MIPTMSAEMLTKAKRLVELAEDRSLRARLVGGLAVLAHAHADLPTAVPRSYGDIDLVIRQRDSRSFGRMMTTEGYKPNERFNALHGEKRLMFFDQEHERRVDVFVGRFEMCHTLNLEDRLPDKGYTLALADLLLTKLQIVQINTKDIVDALTLLRDHDVQPLENPDVLNLVAIREICASDWGWFTTVSDNLQRLQTAASQIIPGQEHVVRERIARIEADIGQAKKSARWKLRGRLGRRSQWYELPEEV